MFLVQADSAMAVSEMKGIAFCGFERFAINLEGS